MDIVAKFGRDTLAVLYVAKIGNKYLEFVESLQPPFTREEKWVLILSTMFGCPVKCHICDAGTYYHGKVSVEELYQQIDFLVAQRFPDRVIPVKKFKIQFARMGEPALNDNVLQVLTDLPQRFQAPGLMPCISTIAPRAARPFLEELIRIKNQLYARGQFQMQFSIHSTDEERRRKIIPFKIWDLAEVAEYGERFFVPGDRKITLNFAAERDSPIDYAIIQDFFDPEKFLIKITPVNPTERVKAHGVSSMITPTSLGQAKQLKKQLEEKGFEVLISIGELEENQIGSNCGQHALKFVNGTYTIEQFTPYQTLKE